jgi:hypothetical protein
MGILCYFFLLKSVLNLTLKTNVFSDKDFKNLLFYLSAIIYRTHSLHLIFVYFTEPKILESHMAMREGTGSQTNNNGPISLIC